MTTVAPPPRRARSAAARRSGYAGAAVFDAVSLYAINRWPGWDAVPFLTADTEEVIGLVNASILVHLAVNLLNLLWDPRWLVSLGEIATSAIGVVVVVRVWQVFPFDTPDDWSGWGLVAHLVLLAGVVGSAIGVVTGVVHLLRSRRPAGPGDGRGPARA